MTIHVPHKHISISCARDMLQISARLFQLGISYFEHVRIYHDGRIAWLSTDDIRAKTILENEIAGALEFDFSKIKMQRYIFAEDLVETIKNPTMRKIASQKLEVSKDQYDIRNLFQAVSVRDNNIYEAFIFGTNAINNLSKTQYVNLIPLIEEFILYYYNNGIELINEAQKKALKIPELKILSNMTVAHNDISFDIRRYYFELSNQKKYLTAREYEVCYLLYHGYSRKSVAEFLGKKPKTIDSLIAKAIDRNSFYNLRNLLVNIKNSDLKRLFETMDALPPREY